MKRTVLYIDDEEANLRTFRSVFRREYTILTAKNGKEGLQLLEEQDPDILITDQCMPEMSGVELLKILFESKPDRRPSRIMLSGFAEAEDVKEAKEKYLLKKFVSKPWKKEEMRQTIEESILED